MFEHYQQTIAVIPEPWLMGPGMGAKYAQRLNQTFAVRTDKQKVEDALALGWYALHTEQNKQHRHAVRAVLLATFLMKGQPTSLAQSFKRHYMTMPIERLKQEFVHLFPAFFEDGKRSSWAPHNFTDPRMLKDLMTYHDWRKGGVPNYKFLVHNVTHPSKALPNPEKVLSGWLAISASVLSSRKPIAYSNHGLILEVPENNILTTSPTDQWFDNYAGTDKSQKAPGQSMAKHIIEKNLLIGGLLTPDEVVERQNTPTVINHHCGAVPTKHNEVVICGKENEVLPYGKTGRLRLLAVFVQINMDGSFPDFYSKSNGRRAEIRQAVRKCADTFKVPMLYLPTNHMQ